MTSDKAMGWLQFAGGALALAVQVLAAFHGAQVDTGHVAVSTGLTLGGAGTIMQANKLNK